MDTLNPDRYAVQKAAEAVAVKEVVVDAGTGTVIVDVTRWDAETGARREPTPAKVPSQADLLARKQRFVEAIAAIDELLKDQAAALVAAGVSAVPLP